MPTRNINLTDHYEGFIAEQVTSGRFQNASEVVRAALGLMEQKTAEDEAKIEALRNAVLLGVEQYERGDYITISSDEEMDHFFSDIRTEIDQELAADTAE